MNYKKIITGALIGLTAQMAYTSYKEDQTKKYYRQKVCKEEPNCIAWDSGDYVYAVKAIEGVLLPLEEYKKPDLETKLREIPIEPAPVFVCGDYR